MKAITRKRRPPRPAEVPEDHEWCSRGDHWLPRESFSPHKTRTTGLQTNCRACQTQAVVASQQRTLEVWALPRSEQRKVAGRARKAVATYRDGKRVKVRKILMTPRDLGDAALRKVLLLRTQQAAQAAEIPCELYPEDIALPEECPITGAKMQRTLDNTWGNSFVVLRIEQSAGYVRGNVVTLSAWAADRLTDDVDDFARLLSRDYHTSRRHYRHFTHYQWEMTWAERMMDWVASGKTLAHAAEAQPVRQW